MTSFGEFEDCPWRARNRFRATPKRFPLAFSPSYRTGGSAEEIGYEYRPPERSYLGGYIHTFTLSTLPVSVSIFCPRAAAGQRAVEVFVYAHGLLRCPPVQKKLPEGFITAEPFKLGEIVDASGRRMVLVVPFFDWKPGQKHALGRPANLNRLVDEVLDQVGNMHGTAPPSLSKLTLGGHSRAYDFLEPLAQSYADPQMQQGALARLSEVWTFDTTYSCDMPAWMGWLDSKPNLKVSVFFRDKSPTQSCGWNLYAKMRESGARLSVTPLDPKVVEHCAVPTSQLPGLLNPPGGGSSRAPARELDVDESPLPLRQRIVETAEREWRNWGHGSIDETDPAATPLLTAYYRIAVRQSVTPTQLQSKAWQNDHAWSAVFVSYVMRKAGARGAFPYAAAHSAYVAAAKRAAARHDANRFQAFRIDEAPLEAGDVVCRDRENVHTGHCYGTTFENAESGGHSHGEIVLEVNPRLGYAITIGGNTSQDYPHRGLRGNTVGKHKIGIDGRGFVVSQGKCAYYAVLKVPRDAVETELDFEVESGWELERRGNGPPVTVHLDESELKEWIHRALEGTHIIGSVAEVIDIFHASKAWPAIEAGLTWGEAATGAGAGAGGLALLIDIAVPVGYVALVAMTFLELYRAFSTGTRIQTKKGYCYGIVWAAVGMPNQPRDFQSWGVDSADELRDAFEKGIRLGREKFRTDAKLHNQVLLRLAYEQMTQKRHGWTDPEGRVLNLIWEQVHGDDRPDTHLGWLRGFVGAEYAAKQDNDLMPAPRPPSR